MHTSLQGAFVGKHFDRLRWVSIDVASEVFARLSCMAQDLLMVKTRWFADSIVVGTEQWISVYLNF
jgi:hypothetical protein